MIAETGSAPDRRKASWVTDTLTSARADGVRAVVWFDFSKETDWRLSRSPAVAKARAHRRETAGVAPRRRPRDCGGSAP
jgi:hypothetical protein